MDCNPLVSLAKGTRTFSNVVGDLCDTSSDDLESFLDLPGAKEELGDNSFGDKRLE